MRGERSFQLLIIFVVIGLASVSRTTGEEVLAAKDAERMPEQGGRGDTSVGLSEAFGVSAAVADRSNVLVWLNSPGGNGKPRPDRPRIEEGLRTIGVDFEVVEERKDFQRELRSSFYTDFCILGEHSALEDHFAEELREQVYSGKGLVSAMFTRPDLDASLFGIVRKGYLSGRDCMVELLESEVFDAGLFLSRGRAIGVEALDPGEIIGWMAETTGNGIPRYPAVVKKSYGRGNVLFLAFDLGLSTMDDARFVDLLGKLIDHIHRTADVPSLYPNRLIPVQVGLWSLAGAFDLRVSGTWSGGIRLYDPEKNRLTEENPSWTTHLFLDHQESEKILTYVLLPDEAGTYRLKAEVSVLADEGYHLHRELTQDLVVEKDSSMRLADVVAVLSTLAAGGQSAEKAENALQALTRISHRPISTAGDIQRNIFDILRAIAEIRSISSTDTSDVRYALDELLKSEESRYYCFSNLRH